MKYNIKIVLFSRDRPMQCDATIRSLDNASLDADLPPWDVLVSYSTDRFKKGYEILAKRYNALNFIWEKDFKNDLLASLQDYEHVLFVVDDCLFTRNFYLEDACRFLSKHDKALVFSYRMGLNISYCYPVNKNQQISHYSYDSDFCWTDWKKEILDWNYPMDISSSMYRVADISTLLNALPYSNPNQLEYFLDRFKYDFQKNLMGFYLRSAAFCNPINKVNIINANRSGNNPDLTTNKLLDKFLNGYRIDIARYVGMNISSPHQESEVGFTK